MRGVASGGNGNHSGSQPSVGVYLDEQPITTIQGALDIHMYDIARIEALAGPQGTLYGASSEAGTLRIITNKPDPSGFARRATRSRVNTVDARRRRLHAPRASSTSRSATSAAIRLVGWREHDAGYIDNMAGTRTFPTSGITVSNADGCTPSATLECFGHARKHYNDVDTSGARAALKVDLNDNWSITPDRDRAADGLARQLRQRPGRRRPGGHALLPGTRRRPLERRRALTVQGKIGNFDLTYAFAHLKRNDEAIRLQRLLVLVRHPARLRRLLQRQQRRR